MNSELIPGINPIEFKSLADYKKFSDWRKMQGHNCPSLYFKRQYTTQNNLGYKLIPDPTMEKIYVPYSKKKCLKRDIKKEYLRNINNSELLNDTVNLPGFDPTDQDIGKKNKIDMKF